MCHVQFWSYCLENHTFYRRAEFTAWYLSIVCYCMIPLRRRPIWWMLISPISREFDLLCASSTMLKNALRPRKHHNTARNELTAHRMWCSQNIHQVVTFRTSEGLTIYRRRLPWGNGGDCPRAKTPHRAPPCEILDPPYDNKLVFVQKIASVLRKINKNCCHQSCTFWLQYAPNCLSAIGLRPWPTGEAYSAPPDP